MLLASKQSLRNENTHAKSFFNSDLRIIIGLLDIHPILSYKTAYRI